MEFHAFNNVPMESVKSRYGYGMMQTRGKCEFKSKLSPECLEGGDANEFELAQKCTLADLYNSMRVQRKLVIELIFKTSSKIDRDFLRDQRLKFGADEWFSGEAESKT